MGKSALSGLKGVNRVENGFLNRREINRVFYDPEMISVEEMQTVLERAGTFAGIAE